MAPSSRFACVAAIAAGVLALSAPASAAVQLPSFFSDHLVLQRDQPIPVWGWAAAGETVSVQLGDQAAVTGTAGADGTWKVRLPAAKAGGPFTLVVKGGGELRVNDVLVGEVWLCSGQSNMEFTVDGVNNAAQEKAAATDSAIRQLWVPRRPASQPEARLDARWTVGSPATVGGFTACGYFMARQLRKELDVPVGLINASWGGTRIEPWTPAEAFKDLPLLADIWRQLQALDPRNPAYQKQLGEHLERVEAWARQARAALGSGSGVPAQPALSAELQPLAERKDPQQQPTTLYNGMIHALAGFGMRGAIWYQGESNHGEGLLYTEKMKALIGGWRRAWGIGDFPFYYVQIAPYSYGGEDPAVLPSFWVAQSAALAIPGTGMVVTNDIGTLTDIHPRNKQEVGRRLALLALNRTYGKAGVVCEGPTPKATTSEGGKLRVTFANAAGLATRDGKPPTWFEVLGEDTDFVKADAVIEGESVLLSAAQVAKPIAMRFAWSRDAEPNLVNGAGLPAAAFTAGGVPYVDLLAKVPEAQGYELAYAIDLARLGAAPAYEVDNSAALGAFDRVGYFLELQQDGRPVKYVWTAMDAFTGDARKIALPTLASGATFQQAVRNLTVASNVKEVASGSFPDGGNLEFWPNNYGPANAAMVPGAADGVFDQGDQIGEPKDGYGCMQVHNHQAQQTVFAINNWKAGAAADLGIGNSAGETRDWTFKANAASYTVKKLRVFVHPKR
jgi:sialate O-acetylesterase